VKSCRVLCSEGEIRNDNTVSALSLPIKRKHNPVVGGQSQRKGWRDEWRENTDKNEGCRMRIPDEEKEGKEYLLPSVTLAGRGLTLNMLAAHPKGGL